jgi:transposase InsO family protein
MRIWDLRVFREFLSLVFATLHVMADAASAAFKSRAVLQLENLALRHQLGVLRRSVKRPKLTPADRFLWAWLCEIWNDWRSSLMIVKPATVIAWHRKSFRLFWTWKVRHGQPGRPGVSPEVRDLIRRLSRENPLWGAPRIHGERLKLSIDIGETSVGKYMLHRRKPPSQTWRTFLENHVKSMVSVDFFTVPTLRFQILYVFLVLAHDRRRIVHFGVTAHPTAEWTVQQLREAFPWDTAPRYLLRDRDSIFGLDFVAQVKAMGIKEVLSAPRSPWQRAYVERVIGTFRRECLDHVIVFNEASLYRHVKLFTSYYHESRTHLSLGKDTPEPRPVQPIELGGIIAIPQLGGLHHRYERRAA